MPTLARKDREQVGVYLGWWLPCGCVHPGQPSRWHGAWHPPSTCGGRHSRWWGRWARTGVCLQWPAGWSRPYWSTQCEVCCPSLSSRSYWGGKWDNHCYINSLFSWGKQIVVRIRDTADVWCNKKSPLCSTFMSSSSSLICSVQPQREELLFWGIFFNYPMQMSYLIKWMSFVANHFSGALCRILSCHCSIWNREWKHTQLLPLSWNTCSTQMLACGHCCAAKL